MQKSDGDLVGLTPYDQDSGVGGKHSLVSVSGYFGSSSSPEESLKYLTASTRVESALASMVPCKSSTPDSNSFLPYKESDTNGNDIR